MWDGLYLKTCIISVSSYVICFLAFVLGNGGGGLVCFFVYHPIYFFFFFFLTNLQTTSQCFSFQIVALPLVKYFQVWIRYVCEQYRVTSTKFLTIHLSRCSQSLVPSQQENKRAIPKAQKLIEHDTETVKTATALKVNSIYSREGQQDFSYTQPSQLYNSTLWHGACIKYCLLDRTLHYTPSSIGWIKI